MPQDPNFFGGETGLLRAGAEAETYHAADHPLSVPNRTSNDGQRRADYRGIGLADMAAAIAGGRPHRCSFELALHTTEVLEAILASAESAAFRETATPCARPDPFPPDAARALMRPQPGG